jgi:hypothetical protein
MTNRDPSQLLRELLSCVHQPNPTDPSRWDIAPGRHKRFCALVEAVRVVIDRPADVDGEEKPADPERKWQPPDYLDQVG